MNKKTIIISGVSLLSGLVIAGAISTNAGFITGNNQGQGNSRGPIVEIKEALDSGDYDLFLENANDMILQIIDSEEKFNKFVEIHNLMQEGDREGAKAIAEELGLPQMRNGKGLRDLKKSNGGIGLMGKLKDLKETLESGDYESFKEKAGDRILEIIDTEDEFNKLVEMHNLAKEGDREGAKAIADELGLVDQIREKFKGGNGKIKESIETGDYELFVENAGGFLSEVIDTEDEFNKFVEMHYLVKDGDIEGAKKIADELGIGLPKIKEKIKNFRNSGVREAILSGDYDAFVELADEKILEVIDNEEKFNQLLEIHNLVREGDFEGAKALADELGLPEAIGKMFKGGNGEGGNNGKMNKGGKRGGNRQGFGGMNYFNNSGNADQKSNGQGGNWAF